MPATGKLGAIKLYPEGGFKTLLIKIKKIIEQIAIVFSFIIIVIFYCQK